MTLTTTQCASHGHPEISFEVDTVVASTCEWLIHYFEEAVRTGTQFKAGQTVQLGWSLLMVKRAPNESLELHEPDFLSMPIQWTKGVSNTVRHLMLQRSVCSEFDCEPEVPSLQLPAVISPAFLESSEYTLSRDHISEEGDSGWVMAEKGYAGSEGRFVSLYELALHKNAIIPFLALPPGSVIHLRPGAIELSSNGRALSSSKGNNSGFLEGLVAGPLFR